MSSVSCSSVRSWASRTQRRRSSGHLVVAAARRVQARRRIADDLPSRLSTFMWMSSSAVENVKAPDSISPSTCCRPAWIASRSSSVMMPCCASMALWAIEPWMSCARQAPVETDGGVDGLHERAGGRREPPAPHGVGGRLLASSDTVFIRNPRDAFATLAASLPQAQGGPSRCTQRQVALCPPSACTTPAHHSGLDSC